MTSTTVSRAPPDRGALRDPVLLVPLVVAAGLAIGWLGVDEGASGARVAADLALAWALVGASVVVLERPRWRPARLLLAAAAFALLVADLQWSHQPTLWTLGLLFAALWVALLVHLVLTFPEGRPWSGAASVAILAAYVVTFGGQLLDALVGSDARDVLSVAPHARAEDAIDRAQEIAGLALAAILVILVLHRVRVVHSPARRAQLALLAAATASALAAIVWLGSLLASGAHTSALETTARWVAVTLPLGVVADRALGLHRRGRRRSLSSCEPMRRKLKERLARALGDPRSTSRIDSTTAAMSIPKAARSSFRRTARAVTAVTSGGEQIAALVHDPALLDGGTRGVGSCDSGLVLENERLAAEVRSQLAEVRASRGGSSPRPTPNAAESSETSTTAHSNDW
jgi:hypothetical protein